MRPWRLRCPPAPGAATAGILSAAARMDRLRRAIRVASRVFGDGVARRSAPPALEVAVDVLEVAVLALGHVAHDEPHRERADHAEHPEGLALAYRGDQRQ